MNHPLTVDEIATNMLARYSTPKIAAEMAHAHAMDFREGSESRDKWLAVHREIRRRSERSTTASSRPNHQTDKASARPGDTMRVPCNTGAFSYRHKTAWGKFEPRKGTLREHSDNKRVGWSSGDGIYSALVLVGLESPSGKTYSVEDVVRIVKRVRTEQAGDPSASLISQIGLYKHKSGDGVVEEESIRIIILHLTDETREAFREHIVALAEELARELRQEEVIVEFQNRGVTEDVLGITR